MSLIKERKSFDVTVSTSCTKLMYGKF